MQGEQNVVRNVEGLGRYGSGRTVEEGGSVRIVSVIHFEDDCFQKSPRNKWRMMSGNVKGIVDLRRPSCAEQSDNAFIVTGQYELQCDPAAVEEVNNVEKTVSQMLMDGGASVAGSPLSSWEGVNHGSGVNDLPRKNQSMVNGNMNRIVYLARRDWASLLRYSVVHQQVHNKCSIPNEVLVNAIRFSFQKRIVQLL